MAKVVKVKCRCTELEPYRGIVITNDPDLTIRLVDQNYVEHKCAKDGSIFKLFSSDLVAVEE